MRNDLLNPARRAHIQKRKGYKDAQKTPKGAQKPRPLSEVVLSDAVGIVFGTRTGLHWSAPLVCFLRVQETLSGLTSEKAKKANFIYVTSANQPSAKFVLSH